jgi:NAD(P)-dependent dehydrogenase (short-subunit alcohol dehydrogenase family)
MRTVLITGTSSGFGLLSTVELARRGWRVFATMRDLDRKGPLLAALDAAGVRNAVAIGRLREAVAAMLLATGGRLDAVVHNAGVAAGGAFEDLPDEDVRRVLETNFFGVLDLTRALLPAFRAQRAGRIQCRARQRSSATRPTRSTAPRSGRSRAGPRRSATSLVPSASRWC